MNHYDSTEATQMRLLRRLLLTGLGTLTTFMVRTMPVVAQVAVESIAETVAALKPTVEPLNSPTIPTAAAPASTVAPSDPVTTTGVVEHSTGGVSEPLKQRAETLQILHSAMLQRFQTHPETTEAFQATTVLASLHFQLLPATQADTPAVAPTPEAPQRFAPTARAVKVGRHFQLEITPMLSALVSAAAPNATPTTRSDAADRLIAASQAALEASNREYVPAAQTAGYQGVPAPPVAIATLIASMSYPLSQPVSVTSEFGWRTHPISGQRSFHAGIDLGAAYGTPVLATIAGQVIAVGYDGGYGLRIVIQNGQLQTVYAHLSKAYVMPGAMLQQGQPIGEVGSSGYATGPHLHLELRVLTASGWQPIDFAGQLETAAQRLGTIATPSTLLFNLPTGHREVEMRVGLVENAAAVTLTTSTPAWIVDLQGHPIATIPGMQPFLTRPNVAGMQMGGGQLPPIFFLQPTQNGAVAVGDRWYRGRVLVVSRPGGLTVVNWVDLEAYLYSVVGAEAYPSWHQEALKAQAVAARSYALCFRFNPASELYDLGADTRYQEYRGIETEYNTTAQAVEATRGQVLLDRSGSVLLAEYAATQNLSDTAHGGFGMSQWGASDLAQQGFNYLQILGRYYQGASLRLLAQR